MDFQECSEESSGKGKSEQQKCLSDKQMGKFMMTSFMKKKKIIIGYKEGKKPNWYKDSLPSFLQ